MCHHTRLSILISGRQVTLTAQPSLPCWHSPQPADLPHSHFLCAPSCLCGAPRCFHLPPHPRKCWLVVLPSRRRFSFTSNPLKPSSHWSWNGFQKPSFDLVLLNNLLDSYSPQQVFLHATDLKLRSEFEHDGPWIEILTRSLFAALSGHL